MEYSISPSALPSLLHLSLIRAAAVAAAPPAEKDGVGNILPGPGLGDRGNGAGYEITLMDEREVGGNETIDNGGEGGEEKIRVPVSGVGGRAVVTQGGGAPPVVYDAVVALRGKYDVYAIILRAAAALVNIRCTGGGAYAVRPPALPTSACHLVRTMAHA